MRKDPIVKICLAGLFLALTIIFTRFIAIQNIPVIPFVRISLGPALIIFASIYLGPFYGAIVGGGSDILGILLVPNTLGYSINPWFTLIYTILGIVPYFVFKLLRKNHNDKIDLTIFIITMVLLWLFVLIYGLCNSTIGGHNFEPYQKVLLFSISFVLSIGTILAIIFLRKHFEKSDVPFLKISCLSLLCEIFVMLIGNSIVKSIFFEVDYLVILFFQSIVFFIDIPLNSFVVSYLLKLTNKVFFNKNRL